MRCEVTLTLKTWILGLLGRRSFSQIKSGGTLQPTRWPLLMRAAAKQGLEVEHVDEAGKAGARASATTMVITNQISNRGILRHLPGSSSTSHPMAVTAAITVAHLATATAAATSTATAAGTAASADAPRTLGQLGETTSPSVVQPLDQLGETTSPTAVP